MALLQRELSENYGLTVHMFVFFGLFYGFAVSGLLFKSAGRLVVTCALFLRGLRPPGRQDPCTLRRGLAFSPPGAVQAPKRNGP